MCGVMAAQLDTIRKNPLLDGQKQYLELRLFESILVERMVSSRSTIFHEENDVRGGRCKITSVITKPVKRNSVGHVCLPFDPRDPLATHGTIQL